LVPVQPLIQSLFGALMEIEVLVRIAGETKTSFYDIARETFAGLIGLSAEIVWRKFLYNGFQENSAAKPVNARAQSNAFGPSGAKTAALNKNHLEIVFYRDYKVDDGRFSNNSWMQELPDPITKL